MFDWMNDYVYQEFNAGYPEHLMDLPTHVGPEENFLIEVAINKSESWASSQISVHNLPWHLETQSHMFFSQ